jgi:hypothetical protein
MQHLEQLIRVVVAVELEVAVEPLDQAAQAALASSLSNTQ